MPWHQRGSARTTTPEQGLNIPRIIEPDFDYEVEDGEEVDYQIVTLLVRANPESWGLADLTDDLTSCVFGDIDRTGDITLMGWTPVRSAWRNVASDWADGVLTDATNINLRLRQQQRGEGPGEAVAPDTPPGVVEFPASVEPLNAMFGFNAGQIQTLYGIGTRIVGADGFPASNLSSAATSFPTSSWHGGLQVMFDRYRQALDEGDTSYRTWRRIEYQSQAGTLMTLAVIPPIACYPTVGPLTSMQIDEEHRIWLAFGHQPSGGGNRVRGMYYDDGRWDFWSNRTPGAPGTLPHDSVGALALPPGYRLGAVDGQSRKSRWERAATLQAERWPHHFGDVNRLARSVARGRDQLAEYRIQITEITDEPMSGAASGNIFWQRSTTEVDR